MKGKVIDLSDKITVLYFIHFGNKFPDLATCKDCVDYELRLCAGSDDNNFNILDCMYDKAKKCEFFTTI